MKQLFTLLLGMFITLGYAQKKELKSAQKLFKAEKKALIGDCAVASMFLSYCGAFNQVCALLQICLFVSDFIIFHTFLFSQYFFY